MAIDLRSDTVTRPTPAMRAAMADAEVGDDERDGDPTTRRLEERVAALLGKEAALFFPSGTMANQAAVWVHVERATEVLADVDAHIVHSEIAGIGALSGAQVLAVTPSGTVMSADDLRCAFRPRSRYYPAPSLVCVENTHNGAGGRVSSLEELGAIRTAAAEQGLPVHLDGARLWNAIVATGIEWKRRDVIVCFREEFPANLFPWQRIEQEFGAEIRWLSIFDPLESRFALLATPKTIDFPMLIAVLLLACVAVSALGSGLTLRRFPFDRGSGLSIGLGTGRKLKAQFCAVVATAAFRAASS